MKENKRSALSVLLILVMLAVIGVTIFHSHTRRSNQKTEVKTTVFKTPETVERVIREFEAKPTSAERDIEVTGKFRAGMKTGPRKSDMFNNMNMPAQPTTQLGE
jgi:hypothetical protein